jgi:hypothetical protein
MVWRYKNLVTIGDWCEALETLETEADAKQFIELALQETPEHPEIMISNIGYLTGYLSSAKAERLREWMQTPHPIFGMKSPTPDDAFKAGLEQGKKAKERGDA